MTDTALFFIPLLPFVGFLINGLLSLRQAHTGLKPNKKLVALVACAGPLFSFLLCLKIFAALAGNESVMAIRAPFAPTWIALDDLIISFGLTLDHLSSLMSLIVTGVGTLIHIYSIGYMSKDENYPRYMAYINLFLFFMLTLILADSLPLLFVGWEGVGLCSYLLIGFWFTDVEKAVAGKKAFITNRVGDFAFLIGMFLIVVHFSQLPKVTDVLISNYLDFSFLQSHAADLLPIAGLVALCFLFGATGKSAQIPLYVWLPDAMAGPTPVSALIHAATMVTAGIYLVARMSFLFVMTPVVMQLMATIGLATALIAALIAVTQNDIKKVLAYSTVSQLGFMFLGLGAGGFSAAIFHVMTHAFFKACLFLGAGSVIHGLHHEQDIRKMGGLWRKMPITTITFFISTLAIAGLPPFSGFFSKDEILYMVYASPLPKIYYCAAFLAAGLTAFYMMRVFVLAFLGRSTRYEHPEWIHESPITMTLPLMFLAALAVVAGFVGLPHVIGHNHLAEWLVSLGQVTPEHIEGSRFQEVDLMVLSASWAAFASLLGYVSYRFPTVPRALFRPFVKATSRLRSIVDKSPAPIGWVIVVLLSPILVVVLFARGFYRLMENKFYVDEIYEFLIITPIQKISDVVLYKTADVGLIDGGMVNGTASLANVLARLVSMLHTGIISRYALYIGFGVAAMAWYLVFGH